MKSLESRTLCIFWTVWKARNDIVFRDEVLSMQFVYLFWSETKVFFADDHDPCSFH